jgi:hypothetical protein
MIKSNCLNLVSAFSLFPFHATLALFTHNVCVIQYYAYAFMRYEL